MRQLTFMCLIACLGLTACASNQAQLRTAPPAQPRYFPRSMSTGTGTVNDACGQYKFSDPACNPALNAGGN
jgi:hypothetical protein